MLTYVDELKSAMNSLATHDDSIFVGQAVQYPGTGMHQTLSEIDESKKLELPVEEDFQLGLSIGLAIAGMIPVSIFPRWNFLLLATNQLVNHLDKLKELFQTDLTPKVIIRTAIGSVDPLHPGPQHVGDFSEPFKLLLPRVEVVRLDEKSQIFPEYERALNRTDGVSTILVEWSDKYNE